MSFPDPPRLAGEIVVLRDFRDADAESLAAAFAEDPDLGRLLGLEEEPTVETFRVAPEVDAEGRRSGRWLGLAVADRSSDEAMGVVNLYGLDAAHRRCELGVWLRLGARGRGAAAEAMRLMCGWAFGAIDLQRIGLRTLPDNEPMLRAAERVGFRFEGVLRHYTFERGRPVDNAVCSILRAEAPACRA